MAESRRRLIAVADDFGASREVNEAVRLAHKEGILTCASLMVAEPAAEEAVALAKASPALGIGLHLTLVRGRSALPPGRKRGLTDASGKLETNPVRAGLRFFFQRELRADLEREIDAQFKAFAATGLRLDHVNGHLNIHLHPTVFHILLGRSETGRAGFRLTRDDFFLSCRLARGRWGYRISHAIIFGALAAWARPRLRRRGVPHAQRVFGLLETGAVNERRLCRLLPRLPRGVSEFYCHPSLEKGKAELEALVSPAVKRRIRELEIELIRYQDL